MKWMILFLPIVLWHTATCRSTKSKQALINGPVTPAPMENEEWPAPIDAGVPDAAPKVVTVVKIVKEEVPCPIPPPPEKKVTKFDKLPGCPDAFAACLMIDSVRDLIRYVNMWEEYGDLVKAEAKKCGTK